MEIWQIVLVIITAVTLLGGIIWRYTSIELRLSQLSPLPQAMKDLALQLERVKVKVEALWESWLEDGRGRRLDLRVHQSEWKLTEEAKQLIPEEVREALRQERAGSNQVGHNVIMGIKVRLTLRRLADIAQANGMSLQEYFSLIVDYKDEETNGGSQG